METEIEGKRGPMELGGSLPVDNVQALASKKLDQVPARYIRPDLRSDRLLLDETLQVPVIDISKLEGGCESLDIEELAKLHLACRDWGFYQVINHGVPDEVIDDMKTDMKEFFELPLEDKLAYAQIPNSIEGYGQAFVVSEEQQLDWGDMFFVISQPVELRNNRFWPIAPPTFRATMDRYSKELLGLAERLLRLTGLNLGLDPETLQSLFDGGVQAIRMNYYPPCKEADKVIGLSPHSDSTGQTLLVQANEVAGLQIKRAGKWVPIKPVRGAIIVNIGDIIEIMSNGDYKSIEHRAVVNPDQERLSIAAFHSPNMSAMVGPISELATEAGRKYKTVPHEEIMKMVVSSNLDGKAILSRMKVEEEVEQKK